MMARTRSKTHMCIQSNLPCCGHEQALLISQMDQGMPGFTVGARKEISGSLLTDQTTVMSVDSHPRGARALLRLLSAQLLEASHILVIEQRGIPAIDGKEEAVLTPLMHGLPPHPKELAHLRQDRK